MATSSILGAERAPILPAGRDSGALGPSDSSDSGSDVGSLAPEADSDRQATGERASVSGERIREGNDISPDRITGARDAGEQAEDEDWTPESGATPKEADTLEELDFDDDPIEDPAPPARR